MRRGAWSVAWVLLLASGVAQAGSSMTPVQGDIDHRLDAQLDGLIATGASSVLSSLTAKGQPPVLRGFQLEAQSAEATIVRTSQDASASAFLSLPLGAENAVEANEEVETQLYRDLSVQPLATTALWNVVAFGMPGDPFEVHLPEGTYTLGQAGEHPQLLRPEVPRTKALRPALDPVHANVAGALEIQSQSLSATYRGDFAVLLYGAAFQFTSADGKENVESGPYERTDFQVSSKLLPSKRTVNQVVLLRVHSGVFSLQAGDAALKLNARSISLDGRATFEAPSGTLTWDGRAEPADAPSRTLEGQLHLTARGPAYARPDGERFGPLTIQGLALLSTPGAAPTFVWVAAAAGALAVGAGVRWVPGLRRLALAAVAGFSLVQKDGALEHPGRSQLYEYVRTNPGATLSVVQGHLGLGWGTVEYHVAVLERLGLLVTKRAGGKRLLFATGQGRIVDTQAWSLMRNPSVRQLGTTLLVPGRAATQAEIAQALDCSPQYAGRLARKLVEAGLVQAHTEADRRAFVATELFHDLARRTGLLVTPAREPVALEAPLTA